MAEITVEQVQGFMQMNVPTGYYITQSGSVDNEDRLFVRRRMLLHSESVTDWKVVTEQEARAFEQAHNNLSL